MWDWESYRSFTRTNGLCQQQILSVFSADTTESHFSFHTQSNDPLREGSSASEVHIHRIQQTHSCVHWSVYRFRSTARYTAWIGRRKQCENKSIQNDARCIAIHWTSMEDSPIILSNSVPPSPNPMLPVPWIFWMPNRSWYYWQSIESCRTWVPWNFYNRVTSFSVCLQI